MRTNACVHVRLIFCLSLSRINAFMCVIGDIKYVRVNGALWFWACVCGHVFEVGVCG